MRRPPSQSMQLRALDHAPVMIRDLAGRITLWTGEMERVYGYSSADCLGQVAHELLATKFPASRSEIEAEVVNRGVWAGELSERRSDGREITVSSRWSLFQEDGLNSVMICNADITDERRRLQEQRLLASIVESSQDAVIGKDLQGKVTSWNRAAEQMFGYAPEEIIGRPVTVLFPDDLIEEEAMILERLRQGDRIEHYETARRRKDGRSVYVSLTISPVFDADGVVIGASKSIRDISERVALNRRLDELQAELLHASRVNEMGQVASAFAHEFNQPLAAISAFVGGARRQVELGNAEMAVAACRKAETEVMRTAAIIARLENFMKKGPMQRQREVLAPVFQDAIALALVGSSAQGLKVEVNIADDAQAAVIDRVQIQQVLVNLIRNAAQATAGQTERTVRISVQPVNADKIQVEVADNGPGLAPEILARLFEPYLTTKSDGMGVGLSLCRSVIQSHGEDMSAENSAEGGAIFRFTLPLL